KSPANARSRPASSSSASIDVRKPTRPKLTPITGTPVPRKRWNARSIEPSPPSVTARSGRPSSAVTSTPLASARRSTRETASATPGSWLCVTIAMRSTNGIDDPRVEPGGESGLGFLDEVEEELTVAFRSRQARVYDPGGLRPPDQGLDGELADDPPPRLEIPDDSPARLAAARLELRLHEHDCPPPRRRQLEQRRQRLPHADERDIADDQPRRERELGDMARVRPLEHDNPRVFPNTRVQLAIADVEGDHPCGAALQEDVREAARGRSDVEAVASCRVDAENVQCMGKLDAAARDVRLAAGHLELGRLVHLRPGLRVPRHPAGQQERLRLGPALRQPSLHKQHVDPFLQAVRVASAATISSRTEVSASIAARRDCARSAASSARRRAPSSPCVSV